MIIFKYLTTQMLKVLFAVSTVMLLILMSGRFISYLGQAASGSLSADFLLSIMAYRMPELLVIVLPLGLFIGIILSYGKLYVDNEMTVLSSSGVSSNQLLIMTMIPALGLMVFIAFLSLYAAPAGIQKVEMILASQRGLTEFDMMIPGRFQAFDGGKRVTYSELLSDDKRMMKKVFIVNRSEGSDQMEGLTLALADYATMNSDEMENSSRSRYLYLFDGYRYDLIPGKPGMRTTKYRMYGVQMPEKKIAVEDNKEQAMTTNQLLKSAISGHAGELQWRLSLPLLIPIIVLLALPLARVNPRQGRFVKLLPALLLYLLYITLLLSARGAVIDGRLSADIGLWWVHIAYLLLSLVLYCYEPAKMMFVRRRGAGA